jgi:hypothetical protein
VVEQTDFRTFEFDLFFLFITLVYRGGASNIRIEMKNVRHEMMMHSCNDRRDSNAYDALASRLCA